MGTTRTTGAAVLLTVPALLLILPGIVPPEAAVVINEVIVNPVGPDSGAQLVELYNTDPVPVDIGKWNLCIRTVYKSFPKKTLIPGGGTLLVHLNADGASTPTDFYTGPYVDLHTTDSIGLYGRITTMADFGNPAFIQDYVQWGGSGTAREDVAAAAGLWMAGDFAALPPEGHSLSYLGSGIGSANWIDEALPTPGGVNRVTPIVVGADPPTLCQGHAHDVLVTGSRFLLGASVSLGAGVTIQSSSRLDPVTLIAGISVDPAATDGPRDITVLNPGNNPGVMSAGFTVDSTAPPDAPGGMTLNVTGDTSVEVSWNPALECASAVDHYEVLRDGMVVGTVTGTGFTDSGLAPGVSHVWSVRAVDASGGVSSETLPGCVTTTAPFLSPRLPCDGTIGSGTAVPTLLWNGGDGTKWKVEVSLDPAFATISKLHGGFLKSTSFTPSLKKWRKALGLPKKVPGGGSNGGGGTGYGYLATGQTALYWRVVGRDASKTLTTSQAFTIVIP